MPSSRGKDPRASPTLGRSPSPGGLGAGPRRAGLALRLGLGAATVACVLLVALLSRRLEVEEARSGQPAHVTWLVHSGGLSPGSGVPVTVPSRAPIGFRSAASAVEVPGTAAAGARTTRRALALYSDALDPNRAGEAADGGRQVRLPRVSQPSGTLLVYLLMTLGASNASTSSSAAVTTAAHNLHLFVLQERRREEAVMAREVRGVKRGGGHGGCSALLQVFAPAPLWMGCIAPANEIASDHMAKGPVPACVVCVLCVLCVCMCASVSCACVHVCMCVMCVLCVAEN